MASGPLYRVQSGHEGFFRLRTRFTVFLVFFFTVVFISARVPSGEFTDR